MWARNVNAFRSALSSPLLTHRFTFTTTREYFYWIDKTGKYVVEHLPDVVLLVYDRLFLEDVRPRNMTTCLKDNKFLNFFFRQLRSMFLVLVHGVVFFVHQTTHSTSTKNIRTSRHAAKNSTLSNAKIHPLFFMTSSK